MKVSNDLKGKLSKIKRTWYDMCNEILSVFKINEYLSIFFLLITHLQLIAYLIEDNSEFHLKDNIVSSIIFRLFSLFRFNLIISALGSKIYTFQFIITIIFTFFLIIILFTVFFLTYNAVKKPLWIKKLLALSLILVKFIFFLPILEIYISTYKCSSGTLMLDVSTICLSTSHIIMIIFGTIGIIIQELIALMTICFMFHFENDLDDSLSSRELMPEIQIFMFRNILMILFIFETLSAVNYIKLIFFILFSLIYTIQNFKILPYFNEKVSTAASILAVEVAWASLICAIGMVFKINGILVVFVSGCILLWIVIRNVRTYFYERHITSHVEKAKSEADSFNIIDSLTNFISKNETLYYRLLVGGLIGIHPNICPREDCPLKNPRNLYDSKERKYFNQKNEKTTDKIYLKHYLKTYYDDFLLKYPGSIPLLIGYSFFIFHYFHNFHRAIELLFIAERLKPSFVQSYTIYRFIKMIELFLKKNEFKDPNYAIMPRVIECEELLTLESKEIEKVAQFQIDFLSFLTLPIINISHLNKKCNELMQSVDQVDRYYDNLKEICPHHQIALELYSNYQKVIRNNEKMANRIKDADELNIVKEHYKQSNLFDKEAAIIHISGLKEKFGKITKINQATCDVFGYVKSELIGHSVNSLMTNSLGARHDKILENRLDSGISDLMVAHERSQFIVHKKGNIIKIRLVVKVVPLFENEIEYVGMIIKSQDENDYIVTNMEGIIEGMTENIANSLNCSQEGIKSTELNIQILSPALMKLFPIQESNEDFLKFKPPKSMRVPFFLPDTIKMMMDTRFKKKLQTIKESMNADDPHDNTEVIITANNRLNNKDTLLMKDSLQITSEDLLELDEYRNCRITKKFKCQISISNIALRSNRENYQELVFKILKNSSLKKGGVDNLSEFEICVDENGEEKKSSNGSDNSMVENEKVIKILNSDLRKFSSKEKENLLLNNLEKEKGGEGVSEKLHSQMQADSEKAQEIQKNQKNEEVKNEEIKNQPNSDDTTVPVIKITAEIVNKHSSENVEEKHSPKDNEEKSEDPVFIDKKRDPNKNEKDEKKKFEFTERESSESENPTQGENLESAGFKKPGILFYEELDKTDNEIRISEEEIVERKKLLKGLKKIKDTKQLFKAQKNLEEKEANEEEKIPLYEASIKSNDSSFSIMSDSNHIRTLIDDKYVPVSLHLLRLFALLLFAFLLFYTIFEVTYKYVLINQFLDISKSIKNSENQYLILSQINIEVLELILLNNLKSNPLATDNILDIDSSEFDTIGNARLQRINNLAENLKSSQQSLEPIFNNLPDYDYNLVNNDNLITFRTTNKTSSSVVASKISIWVAVLELITCAFRISDIETYDQITIDLDYVYSFYYNTLNTVKSAILLSNENLMEIMDNSSHHIIKVLLVLFILFTGIGLTIVIIIIIMVYRLMKVASNTLELFTKLEKPVVESVIKTYKTFIKEIRKRRNLEEEDEETEEEIEKKLEKKEEKKRGLRFASKKDAALLEENKAQQIIPMNQGFIKILISSILMFSIVEIYLSLIFAFSQIFINKLADYCEETQYSYLARTSDYTLILYMKVLISSNGKDQINGQIQPLSLIDTSFKNYSIDNEDFLFSFVHHIPSYSSEMNQTKFSLFFGDSCIETTKIKQNSSLLIACQSIRYGILTEGIYMAMVNLWQNLYSLYNDFVNSPRTITDIKKLYNDIRMNLITEMHVNYIDLGFEQYFSALSSSGDSFHSSMFFIFIILAIIFTVFLCIYIILIFKLVFSSLEEKICKFKKVFSIIPGTIILRNPEITHYLKENSSLLN